MRRGLLGRVRHVGTLGTDGGLLSTDRQRLFGDGESRRRGLERDSSAWRSGDTFSPGGQLMMCFLPSACRAGQCGMPKNAGKEERDPGMHNRSV